MITKLFEKLNNPIAVVLILAAILAVNGFLFYQQGSTPPEANAPDETPAQPSESGPEKNAQTEDEAKGPEEPKADEDDAKSQEGEAAENETAESEAPEPDGRDDAKGEEEEQASKGKGEEDEPSEDEPAEEEPSEEPAEDEPSEDEPAENEPSENEPAENEPSEEPRNGSGGGSRDDSKGGQDGQASGNGSGDGAEGAGRAPLAGLGDALDGCEGDREDCVRGFVSEVSPESSYIGGRTDLASGGEGSNAEILYFEDPGMDTCQFERGRHETDDDLDYTVILVGPGSFNDERGEECIPTT